ncbi:hypothetical protein [Streptomyces sp. NPDC002845]
MIDHTTRRGFLGLSGRAAFAVAGAAALPVICSGPAHATGSTTGPAELPVVTSPDHPDARIPRVSAADHADGVSREPLNASAECGLPAGVARAARAAGGRG